MARGVRDEHDATVIARAFAHELCHILTRYARYPRIVRFARLVTPDGGWYSHWEARVLGHNGYNKWEAVNEGCRIRVVIRYQPRGGLFADLAGELVLRQRFGRRLRADPRDDLRQFATMIEQAPEGGLDPFSPRYLFSAGGVAARERRAAALGRHL